MIIANHSDITAFVTVRVADLIGPALDYAVAKAEGLFDKELRIAGSVVKAIYFDTDSTHPLVWLEPVCGGIYMPSTMHSIGGPIIERERIDLQAPVLSCELGWLASMASREPMMFGPTPLIAAMRAYVMSRLGDTIDIPDFLA